MAKGKYYWEKVFLNMKNDEWIHQKPIAIQSLRYFLNI